MPLGPAILFLILSLVAERAMAQTLVRDDFEGPEATLFDAGGDATYKLEFHRRVQQVAHTGYGSERITVRGNNGTSVYFAHSIGPALVIGELAPSVWIKADRPGMQLLAEVTLPRAIDGRGKPLTTLVRGTGYTQVGMWQQLKIENLPKLFEEQVRVLRAEQRREVDPREAYVERLLVNVYGGPGESNVWIDDLEVAGVVTRQTASTGAVADASPFSTGPKVNQLPPTWSSGQGVPKVDVQGPLLRVGGEPFFPRIIEYRGEPLARLQSLGFNGVLLAEIPTPELLREAARIHMWLVAPPPSARQLEATAAERGDKALAGTFDPVLVWHLGTGLASRELEDTRKWAKMVAAADPRGRPIICDAESDLRGYTRRPINLFLANRQPLGTTLSLKEYGSWLLERAQLVLPGTPLWVTIQTEPSARLAEQVALLSTSPATPIAIEESQLRTLTRIALAAGARGLCFASTSRLDADDPHVQRRAAMLELLNLELTLIERWPASGNFATHADSSDPQVSGAVIETDRSRLLMPIHAPLNGQLVLGNPTVKPLVIRVPGVPEGDNAWELSPTGLRPLESKRVAGGTRVTLSEFERDSLVVFTQDARVIKSLKDRIAKSAPRAAQIARNVAANQLAQVEQAEARLSDVGRSIAAARALRTAAETDLRECDAFLEKKDWNSSYERARHALQSLREFGRAHFEPASSGMDWPLADPLLGNVATLAEHYRLSQDLTTARRGPNLLPTGAFEDFPSMWQAGWRNHQYSQTQLTATVELSVTAAHGGRQGLLLRAAPANPELRLNVVETPPFWITSPGVQVNQGQVVEIQGWVRIQQPISASIDGLLIIDTLAGEPLAQRITTGSDWKQFTLYRAALRSGPVALTFAMTGLGEVWLDDVTIHVVERPGAVPSQQARRLPRVDERGTAVPGDGGS